jgi:hypothetical protein
MKMSDGSWKKKPRSMSKGRPVKAGLTRKTTISIAPERLYPMAESRSYERNNRAERSSSTEL